MRLREKTLIVIVAIFAVLILIEFLFSNSIVMGSFNSLEQNDTLQKIGQADGAYDRELQYMDGLLMDWATRDDSYTYMVHPLASYLEENMGDEVFVSQNLDLIIMADDKGDIIYGKAFDLRNRTAIPLPESFRSYCLWRQPVPHERTTMSRSGVMILPEGPLLVVARPILDSKSMARPRHDDPGAVHRRGVDRHAFRDDPPEPVGVPLRRPEAVSGPCLCAERLGVEGIEYHQAPGRRSHRRLPCHRRRLR